MRGTLVRALRSVAILILMACACGVASFATARRASADGAPPRMTTAVDARDVASGEVFSVILDVSSEGDAQQPTDPRLRLPAGMRAGQPSVSQHSEISIVNGRMSRRSGYKIAWEVVASREGTFTIGPPSVEWNGRRLEANPVSVQVHAPGTMQRAQPPMGSRRLNPFDPFGMFPRFPGGLFDTPAPSLSDLPLASDPDLQLDKPLDANIFLRVVPSARSAVVGEQITLAVYEYVREAVLATGRDPSPRDAHGPSLPDFFRRDLDQPDSHPDPKTVEIDGARWRVFAIDRSALFALRTGDLTIGSWRMSFPGFTQAGRPAVTRETAPVSIRVAEPPLQGRPAGYQIGDVGNYTLTATVDPRATEVGGAVAVTAVISGVGNPPLGLHPPMQSSLEWLEPQVREAIEVDGDKIRGSRTFSYIVRPKIAGEIQLGTLSLPFYDPAKQAYGVARADLGRILVAKGSSPAADSPKVEQDPFRSVGPLRTKLGKSADAAQALTDSPGYWGVLFGSPLAVLLSAWLVRAARRLSERAKMRSASPRRAIEKAMQEARSALQTGDSRAMYAALDRAIHLAIEYATGLRSRGVLLSELPQRLVDVGISSETAEEARDLLASIDAARFIPEAGATASSLLSRSADLTERLSRKARPHGSDRGAKVAATAGFLLLLLTPFRSFSETPLASFEKAVAEMQKGDFDHAIETFESLADQGFVHPDASYDRALAYLGRVRAGAERPGDLGRAGAGFEETLLLRPSDADAEIALEAVRGEVARRRARAGGAAEVEARPTLDRALIGLASEQVWAILALAASLVLTLGLVARALTRSRTFGNPKGVAEPEVVLGIRSHAIRVVGMIAVPIGCLLLVGFATLAFGARHLRQTTQDGVVVVHEVRLTDERGAALVGPPIPEAGRVEIGEQRGGEVLVRWGNRSGWAPVTAVRRLVRASM